MTWRTVPAAPCQDAVVDTDETIDRDLLASGISWLLGGIAVTVLDIRIGRLDLLFEPVGAVLVLIGIRRILAATPPTPVAPWLLGFAVLDLVLVSATEAGILLGEVAVGASGFAESTDTDLGWQVLAGAAQLTTTVGVLLLARHLRRVLAGVASDRWRQVTIAWVGTLLAMPLVLATGALELVFLGLSIVAIAGVLLLVALFATRRAAEDDELDRDFPGRA